MPRFLKSSVFPPPPLAPGQSRSRLLQDILKAAVQRRAARFAVDLETGGTFEAPQTAQNHGALPSPTEIGRNET